MNPEYPVYIVSKGRWEKRMTVKALEAIGVPYRVVVEPQEFDNYAAVIDPAKIAVLPFQDLGQGSIPARNWVWEDAKQRGFARHWILDDNIRQFHRYLYGKHVVTSGTIFKCAEDFVNRYENVGLAGFQYSCFFAYNRNKTPVVVNTRIYSCILIDNSMPLRWRGRYNEDSDLSIRVLQSGRCTLLFQAFLADKQSTLTQKGGNTDELYSGDGRTVMAESLAGQHPDHVSVIDRYGRKQHSINYGHLKRNPLIKRAGVVIPTGINNYGMVLKGETP